MTEWPLLSLFTAWSVTTVLLLIGQPFARQIGWVDRPGPRKIHASATPLIGGVAMFIGFALAFMQLEVTWVPMEGIIVGCGVTLLVGYLDDVRNIKARIRFLIECLIALWIILQYDVEIHSLGNLLGLGEIHTGRYSVAFTMLCIVGLINAINMSDGLDGQAGGQSLIAFLLMLLLAALSAHWFEVQVLLLFVMVILAFLTFNAPWFGRTSAQVFMGDSGSMLLGLGLAWFSIKLTQGPDPVMTPVTALWLQAIPLIDLFSSIVRRMTAGTPLFSPDMGHMHHLFLAKGFSKTMVHVIMVGLTALFGLCGVLAKWLNVPDAIMFYLLLTLFALYCRHCIIACKRSNHYTSLKRLEE